MKQLFIGILIVVLIGIGAFVYRNAKEKPTALQPQAPSLQECTLEAKVCPDGTNVGRTGPNCAFAACLAPNVENASLGISYVAPAGFTLNPAALGSDTTLRAAYETGENAITIRSFPIPAGKTANDVILANTMHESSGMPAKSMSEFSPIITNGHTFQTITVERFEAVVHTEYYLVRAHDVLRFDALDKNVPDWTNPKLDISKLPAHAALLKMLSTLQSS